MNVYYRQVPLLNQLWHTLCRSVIGSFSYHNTQLAKSKGQICHSSESSICACSGCCNCEKRRSIQPVIFHFSLLRNIEAGLFSKFQYGIRNKMNMMTPENASYHTNVNYWSNHTNVNVDSRRNKSTKKSRKKNVKKQASDDETSDDDDDFEDDDDSEDAINTHFKEDAELPPEYRDMQGHLPSLRADVIVKFALNMNRSKVEAVFLDSKLRLNDDKLTKKSKMVTTGDCIDLIVGDREGMLSVKRVRVVSIKLHNVTDKFTVYLRVWRAAVNIPKSTNKY